MTGVQTCALPIYGHQAGDTTLQKVATCIKDSLRTSDYVYRYGGEEMLVLLPQTDLAGAEILGERILSRLQEEDITHCESNFGNVTVSCGISQCFSEDKSKQFDWSTLIRHADKALYQSKTEGRNRVSVYQS